MTLPERSPGNTFPLGYIAEHPLPSGIVGALGLGGYQLLADVAGVGAGRLGRQAFLLIVPDPDPSVPDPGTQISLHHQRLKEETEMFGLQGELLSAWRAPAARAMDGRVPNAGEGPG